PLVISGGTLVRPGRPATEHDELIAAGPVAARITNMRAALAAAGRGVRSCLVMLPQPRASAATSATGPAAGRPST
ncbi:MAG TPA: hypothetical protein VGD91_21740, partial [Trebonia sp.]